MKGGFVRFAAFAALAAIPGVGFLLFSPLQSGAHAGVMDYMFNTMKELFTPIEEVTPAEETKTPIPRPGLEAPEPARTIVFDVRSAESNEPISGAIFTYWRTVPGLKPVEGSVTLTGANALEVPAGTTRVAGSMAAQDRAAQDVSIAIKSKPSEISVPVRLEKGSHAGGTVINEEGLPVEGACVEVGANRKDGGYVLLGKILTDTGGHWSTTSVPPGADHLSLLITHPDYVPSCKVDARRYMQSVNIGQDAHLKLLHGIPVAGRVIDSQGNPVEDAQVSMDNDSERSPSAICAKTDAEGKFRLEHCPARAAALVASAPGHANQMLSVTVAPDMPETVITLKTERPIQFVLVDPDGAPLANAWLFIWAVSKDARLYSSPRSLRTDGAGRVVLAAAPSNADYSVYVNDWGSARGIKVKQGRDVVKVVVPAEGYVVLKAADASTGRPIQDFEVMSQGKGTSGAPYQSWNYLGQAKDGEWRESYHNYMPFTRYRLNASGYRQGFTRWINMNEGSKLELKLLLRPARMRKGHVFDDRGRPAPNPAVYWLDGPYFGVTDNSPVSGGAPIRGNGQGLFEITERDWESGMLLVTADSGMALVSGLDFESVTNIHLKPWGSVACRVSARPELEVRLAGAAKERSVVQLSYAGRTDKDGNSVFEKVYPGEYRVSRIDSEQNRGGEGIPVGSVTAIAGQAVQTQAIPGRKVVLRIAIPDQAKPWVEKSDSGPSIALECGGAGRQDSGITNRSVWIQADKDGRLEEELVPGTYVLWVEPIYDRDACKGGPLKYYFKSDEVKFVVPPVTPGNDAPVDLGTVQLHPEGEAPPPEPENAPPGLLVDKLEGGTLSLGDLRGRYVLIDFWAVWCKPCEAQLPHLKNIWQEFGQRSDFVLLGLCLGEDKKLIGDFVTSHQESWPQGVLLEGFSDPVAEQYGVTALPHILLIGPDGKVIADNLLDDQIGAAVREALGKANR